MRRSKRFLTPSTFERFTDQAHRTRAIILAAERRLRRAALPPLQLIFCTFHDGILTLSGHVPSESVRRLAPGLVQGIRGVCTIKNEVVVVPATDPEHILSPQTACFSCN